MSGAVPASGWARQLSRGLRGRCPRCGSGALFRRWFHMVPSCPRCGLVFGRGEGWWTGAMVMNFTLTAGLFSVVLVVLVALTAPTVPIGSLFAVLVPISVIGPLAFYPVSKTLWVAVDHVFLERL